MDASCFIQDSIHGLSYFIVSRILGTYQTHKIRTATISKINNKSEHILSNESVRIMRYCGIVTLWIFHLRVKRDDSKAKFAQEPRLLAIWCAKVLFM